VGSHFHLLVKMIPGDRFTDEEIRKRFEVHFGDERDFAEGQIPYLREKLSSLSEFMREIKVGFARYYNRRHNRRGYFWGDRFKSVIVDKGATLVNCLAYIDLNPLRAGLVERPEDYRWNSLGYHIQTEDKDKFLSTDFGPVKCASLSLRELHRTGPVKCVSLSLRELHRTGLKEFNPPEADKCPKSLKERIKRYRRYVYEAGALDRPDKIQARKSRGRS